MGLEELCSESFGFRIQVGHRRRDERLSLVSVSGDRQLSSFKQGHAC